MSYTCIILPMPPSLNHIWRGRGARVTKSTRYTAWITTAGIALAQQKPLPRYDGPVAVSISIGRPDKRRRDLDNCGAKAALDLLVRHGVLADDSLVHDLRLRWDAEVVGARVEIETMQARAAA